MLEKESMNASVHERKKPLKCEFCDYSCLLLNILQQHVALVHEGRNPFKCKNCDYSCLLRDSLKQHVTSVHEGKKPFICEYWGVSFSFYFYFAFRKIKSYFFLLFCE